MFRTIRLTLRLFFRAYRAAQASRVLYGESGYANYQQVLLVLGRYLEAPTINTIECCLDSLAEEMADLKLAAGDDPFLKAKVKAFVAALNYCIKGCVDDADLVTAVAYCRTFGRQDFDLERLLRLFPLSLRVPISALG